MDDGAHGDGFLPLLGWIEHRSFVPINLEVAMLDTSIRDAIAAAHPELTAIRRDIHAHPELGMDEHRTAALVAETLRGWGVPVTENVGKLGVVGTIRGSLPGQRAIGLRADMDALTIAEQTGLPYASANAGLMHACGHDGHTAMLLGAAKVLAAHRDFAGTVHVIFQPAEEGRGGAAAMIADGLFERFPCDAVYGMHNMPGIAEGRFALCKGPMMAAAGRWVVTFRETGGHGGATPHLATDATIAQAQFVMGLQTVVSRSVAPSETAVISVGSIHGGSAEASNVMPAEVEVTGTMRCFNPKVVVGQFESRRPTRYCGGWGARPEPPLSTQSRSLGRWRDGRRMAGSALAASGCAAQKSGLCSSPVIFRLPTHANHPLIYALMRIVTVP